MERGGDQHLHGGSFNLNRFHKTGDTGNSVVATGNGKETTPPPPCTVREQDQYMPIANVIRIMRRILPPHAKISDDAKETIQECVSEYISFITGEANERCQREQRKTITAEDILWAMGKLGFDNYVDPLNLFLARFRDSENDRGSYRAEPIVKRNMDYGPMMIGPYGVPYNMGQSQFQFPGMYDAPPAMGVYFRDNSGAGGSSAQNPLINFDPFAQFK